MLHWLLAATLVTASGPNSQPLVIPANAPTTPYDIDPIPHLVVTAGSLLVVGVAEAVVKPVLLGGFNCPLTTAGDRCSPARLWGIDRDVIQWQSLGWRKLSDVTSTGTISLAVVAAGVDAFVSGSATPGADAATDVLMIAESIALSTMFTHVLKFAIRRPRPTMYHPGNYSVENQLSFPSGHVSAVSSAATAYALTFALRHPENPWRFAVMGAGLVLTGATAAGRVGGGMHFYSDVFAGALLGTTVGFLVPYLNRNKAHLQVIIDPDVAGGQRMHMGVEVPY